MARFTVPRELQQTALLVGIVVALVLRGVFIVLGAELISRFTWVFYVLRRCSSSTRRSRWCAIAADEDEDYEENMVIRRVRRALRVSPDFAGTKLRVRVRTAAGCGRR